MPDRLVSRTLILSEFTVSSRLRVWATLRCVVCTACWYSEGVGAFLPVWFQSEQIIRQAETQTTISSIMLVLWINLSVYARTILIETFFVSIFVSGVRRGALRPRWGMWHEDQKRLTMSRGVYKMYMMMMMMMSWLLPLGSSLMFKFLKWVSRGCSLIYIKIAFYSTEKQKRSVINSTFTTQR